MTMHYAVTFEFETRAPVTHRGTVESSRASTGARRAIEQAQAALKPINWISMTFVVLERTGACDDEVSTPNPEPVEHSVEQVTI